MENIRVGERVELANGERGTVVSTHPSSNEVVVEVGRRRETYSADGFEVV